MEVNAVLEQEEELLQRVDALANKKEERGSVVKAKISYYQRLELAMKGQGISKTDVAKIIGKSVITLNRRLSGDGFYLSEVESICEAYGFSTDLFFPNTFKEPVLQILKTLGSNEITLIYKDAYLDESIDGLDEDPSEEIECLLSQGMDKFSIFNEFQANKNANSQQLLFQNSTIKKRIPMC